MNRRRTATALLATGYPDGNRTPCTEAVLTALGVPSSAYRFAHCCKDVVEILRRKGFTVRCCRTELPPVGNPKSVVIPITKMPFKRARYLLRVTGHVLLLDAAGKVLADTDPSRQSSLITHAYRITRP